MALVNSSAEQPLHEMEMRAVYGRTLVELGRDDERIVVLEADLTGASGTSPFKEAFPDRFIDVGVQEANMMGWAAGLSTLGKVPFCATFTPFATRRVYDQLTISVAYARRNVKIVGTAPGITTGPNGGTHMCFQDLAIMRVMPSMTVLCPCDAYELASALKWMAGYDGPVYMRLIRSRQGAVFGPEYEYRHGKAVKLSDGGDVTLISTGYMTQFAMRAARRLAANGVVADHLHIGRVKPLDIDGVMESVGRTGCAVTVENASRLGGLGGAVAEALAEHLPAPLQRIGVDDLFGEVGTEPYLMRKFGLTVEHIAEACERVMARRQK